MKLSRDVTESWEFVRRNLESDQSVDGARVGVEGRTRNQVGEDPRAMGGDHGQPGGCQQRVKISEPEAPRRRIGWR